MNTEWEVVTSFELAELRRASISYDRLLDIMVEHLENSPQFRDKLRAIIHQEINFYNEEDLCL